MSDERWIIVPNWFGDENGEGLQHYRDREPKWIKNYRRLLSKDEYRDLSGHCRGILHGLWLEYAMSDGRLRADSHSLSSRLNLRVTKNHLESLNHAGFIHFSASKPLAISEQNASPEKEVEKEKEPPKPPTPKSGENDLTQKRVQRAIENGVINDNIDLEAELAACPSLNEEQCAFLRALIPHREVSA